MLRRPLSFAAAAALLAGAAAAAPAQDGWWDQDPRPVTFEEILADPVKFRDVPVVLTLQFHERRAVFNPYYTVFTPARHYNFTAWPDSAELWDKEQFLKPHPFFFIARTDPFAERVRDLPARTRLRCRAVVRSIFKGEPWFEVSDVVEQKERVEPGTVRAMIRGIRLFDEGDRDGALAAFAEALETKPGAGSEAAIWHRIARVHWSRHALPEARAAIGKSLVLNPLDRGATSLRDTIEAAEKRLLAISVPKMPGKAAEKAPLEPVEGTLNEPAPAPKPVPAAEPARKPAPVERPAPPPAPKPEPAPAPRPEPRKAAPSPPPPAPEPAPEPKPDPGPAPKPAPVERPAPPPPPPAPEPAPEPEPEPEPEPPPPVPKKRPTPPR